MSLKSNIVAGLFPELAERFARSNFTRSLRRGLLRGRRLPILLSLAFAGRVMRENSQLNLALAGVSLKGESHTKAKATLLFPSDSPR